MAPLQDEVYFAQDFVNPDLGALCWPAGAELGPHMLRAAAVDSVSGGLQITAEIDKT